MQTLIYKLWLKSLRDKHRNSQKNVLGIGQGNGTLGLESLVSVRSNYATNYELPRKVGCEELGLFCNSHSANVFFKWANPDLLYRFFPVFSNKNHYKFYNKLM